MKNESIVRALTAAKEYLWDGRGERHDKNVYICHAIGDARIYKDIAQDDADNARLVIRERLNYCLTLNTWLLDHGIDAREGVPMQTYRLAWINKLIEEHS